MDKLKQTFWPTLVDSDTAKKASRQGFYASIFCVLATVIISVLGSAGIQLFDFNLWALVDATLFAIIAWRLYKMSRAASIAGLILYLFALFCLLR